MQTHFWSSCSLWHNLIYKVFFVFFCRPEANQGNLRSAAYEAIMELIKNSAKVYKYSRTLLT